MLINPRKLSMGIICLLAVCGAACVDTAMMFHGQTITSVPIVALEDGVESAGTWETFDLVINYSCLKKNENLEISGQVELGQSYQMVYDQLRYLNLYLFFTDADSKVLETVYLPGFLTYTTDDRRSFSHSYNVPAGTVGLSFGYDGAVGEHDGHTSFYRLPLNKL